ncbi:hypothetical protein BGX33_006279 [Mortierella sp. NVP41]|nr:hypothetical protein BGX33_006279 [Mortierella sp. NVP41]
MSIVTAVGYGLLAWWTRTASVQEEIKVSVRLAHAAQRSQSQSRTESSSLSSLALASEKKGPKNNNALTPDGQSKILRTSAFVLCPLRVCILLGLVALTLLASIFQGYRIRNGTRCTLYEEPLRGFCRSTKSAVGAAFLQSVLWLCWFAFWLFVSFYKSPGVGEMEVDDDGSSVVRMGLSQFSNVGTIIGGRESDVELAMMSSVPVQWDLAGAGAGCHCDSSANSAEVVVERWHDTRQEDLDEYREQQYRQSRSAGPSPPSSFASLAASASSLSTSRPDGRTLQQQQQPSTPSSRVRKAHPPAPATDRHRFSWSKGCYQIRGTQDARQPERTAFVITSIIVLGPVGHQQD